MKRRVNIETIRSELVMVKVQYKSILKNISEFLTEILWESRLRGIQHLNVKDNKIHFFILRLVMFHDKLGGTANIKSFVPLRMRDFFINNLKI